MPGKGLPAAFPLTDIRFRGGAKIVVSLLRN